MNQFNTLQSGDPVRITYLEGAGTATMDGNVRRLVANETVIVTTPLGEDDPALQTIHYFNDYVSMVSPIPPPAVGQINDIPIGTSVTVKFRSQNSSDLTGILTGIDGGTGIIEVTDGPDVYICKDYWWIKEL